MKREYKEILLQTEVNLRELSEEHFNKQVIKRRTEQYVYTLREANRRRSKGSKEKVKDVGVVTNDKMKKNNNNISKSSNAWRNNINLLQETES